MKNRDLDTVMQVQVIHDKLNVLSSQGKENGERIYRIELKIPTYDLANKLLFGFLGMILIAFAGALIALVLKP
jgi:hypothetical protein